MGRTQDDAHRSGRVGKVVLVAMLLVAIATTGCATSAGASKPSANPKMAMDMKEIPGVQTCKLCKGTADKTVVEQTAALENGVQVANVKIANGYYTPNRILAKAGTPVKFVFTASTPATGCIAVPTFKTLGKSVKVKMGTGSVDLGTLQPGTYLITCKMGSEGGQLIVR